MVIIACPPRSIFWTDILPEELQYYIEKDIWLRLIKLQQSGCNLNEQAKKRMVEICDNHQDKINKKDSDWTLSKYEREEFKGWSSGTGDPDYAENHPDTEPFLVFVVNLV